MGRVTKNHVKTQNYEKKLENTGPKPLQRLLMVAMVTLAAGRRLKMALGLQKFFEILALFRRKSFFFQFNCYYRTIIKLF